MERTLVLLKPDAIQRGLIGEVIGRFERKGLRLVGIKMMSLDQALLNEHYAHLKDKPFFPMSTKFMMSSPVIAMCWEGLEAVEAVRILCGTTNARHADAGSIRGDLAMSIQCNVVHASDTVENGQIEVARFFKKGDLFDYEKAEYLQVYSEDELTK